MNQIFAQLFYEMEKHRDTVLVTLIDAAGSAPRKSGSQMLVGADGRLTGTIGLVGACIILHASYNLLITADGIWRRIGYVFPSLLILLLFLARHLLIPGILPSKARQTASSGKR